MTDSYQRLMELQEQIAEIARPILGLNEGESVRDPWRLRHDWEWEYWNPVEKVWREVTNEIRAERTRVIVRRKK